METMTLTPETGLEDLWKQMKLSPDLLKMELPKGDFTKEPDLPWKLKAKPSTPTPPPTPEQKPAAPKKGRKKIEPPTFRIEKGHFKITFP